MATYKTKGIIIRRRNFGEADRILTIFTEKFGKISAIAKGVRRSLSKLGGHLELFYLTDFILAEGKNLDTVAAAEMIEDYPLIRENKKRSYQAFYISEILDRAVKENEHAEQIFYLLKKTLEEIDANDSSLTTSYFIINLLSQLGHRPELNNCLKCQRKLASGGNLFSQALGGIVCSDCRKYDLGARHIADDAVKIMRIFLEDEMEITAKIKTNRNLESEISEIINGYSEYIIERKIISYQYL